MTPAHIYEQIPGFFSFRRLYDQAVAEAAPGSVLVEVGVLFGRSLAYLAVEAARAAKGLRVVGLDSFDWPPGTQVPGVPPIPREGHEAAARRYLAPLGSLVTLVRASSADGAAHQRILGGAPVSFVFLDGAHDRDSVWADCRVWWPRVMPGGVLAGDDFSMAEVAQGVALWAATARDVAHLDYVPAPEGWAAWRARKKVPR